MVPVAPARRSWPTERYIVGTGEAEEGPDKAAERAKVRVAEQVSSSIQSVMRSMESEEHGPGGDVRSASAHSMETTSTVAFSRGNLIRVVEQLTSGGLFQSTAVLDRDEAVREISADYEPVLTELKAAIASALAHESNVSRFSAEYARTRDQLARLRPLGTELVGVSPREARRVYSDRALVEPLRAARQRVLQQMDVVVTTDKEGPAGELGTVLRRVLGRMGVGGATGAATQWDLRVEVEESYPRAVGTCCRWTPRLRLNGAELPFTHAPVGCHSRDRSLARADLLKKLDGPELESALIQSLAALMPLGDL